MPTLVIREPGRVGIEVPLAGDCALGRDPGNDVVLTDSKVSRWHARISVAPEGCRLTDAGSRHGTWVNGRRVDEHLLAEGDVIGLGQARIEYRASPGHPAHTEITVGAGPTRAETDSERLRILYDVSRAIGSLEDPDELCGRLLEVALAALDCERGVVGLIDRAARGGRRVARQRGPAAGADITISATVLDAIVVRRERVLVRAQARDQPASIVKSGVLSAMGVPLVGAAGVLGFVYLDDRVRADRFTPADLDFLTAIAHLATAALEHAREHRRLANLAEVQRGVEGAGELLGASEVMGRLRVDVGKYAQAPDAAVLVQGESGTGKELVARSLHAQSRRGQAAFVAVNCAAIPDPMIEAELFGHERGAFTGAVRSRRGKLVLADGGTLFLDEVADLSPAAQAKLLRVLEDGEVQPLGADRTTMVDVRIVSATHRDLAAEVAAGRFRSDLYYRLAVGTIVMPPLRARGDDVLALAEVFRERAARHMGRPVRGFAAPAVAALRAYHWPGNVRQLRNEIERAVILCDGEIIETLTLAGAPPAPAIDVAAEPAERWRALAAAREALDEKERRILSDLLEQHGGVLARAARELGVARSSLVSRLQALAVEPPAGDA